MNNKQWFCLHLATPQNEVPLLRLLRDNNIEFEYYSPKYRAEKQLKKKLRPVMRPVFPTYAFLKIEFTQDLQKLIEEIPNCYLVPSASKTIFPINDLEMDQFQSVVKEYMTSGTVSGKKIVSYTQVEIISGSMSGYTATVKAIIKDTAIVEICMFGRMVPITLKKSEISAI